MSVKMSQPKSKFLDNDFYLDLDLDLGLTIFGFKRLKSLQWWVGGWWLGGVPMIIMSA